MQHYRTHLGGRGRNSNGGNNSSGSGGAGGAGSTSGGTNNSSSGRATTGGGSSSSTGGRGTRSRNTSNANTSNGRPNTNSNSISSATSSTSGKPTTPHLVYNRLPNTANTGVFNEKLSMISRQAYLPIINGHESSAVVGGGYKLTALASISLQA